eukprot:3797908-Karenia_brevis.AAC.1
MGGGDYCLHRWVRRRAQLDPRLKGCGRAWRVNSANGGFGHSPVAYHGEYGTMDGRQTVPRAEMTAVIRALLHVQATGHR